MRQTDVSVSKTFSRAVTFNYEQEASGFSSALWQNTPSRLHLSQEKKEKKYTDDLNRTSQHQNKMSVIVCTGKQSSFLFFFFSLFKSSSFSVPERTAKNCVHHWEKSRIKHPGQSIVHHWVTNIQSIKNLQDCSNYDDRYIQLKDQRGQVTDMTETLRCLSITITAIKTNQPKTKAEFQIPPTSEPQAAVQTLGGRRKN